MFNYMNYKFLESLMTLNILKWNQKFENGYSEFLLP